MELLIIRLLSFQKSQDILIVLIIRSDVIENSKLINNQCFSDDAISVFLTDFFHYLIGFLQSFQFLCAFHNRFLIAVYDCEKDMLQIGERILIQQLAGNCIEHFERTFKSGKLISYVFRLV